jgi:hypothetical protein
LEGGGPWERGEIQGKGGRGSGNNEGLGTRDGGDAVCERENKCEEKLRE